MCKLRMTSPKLEKEFDSAYEAMEWVKKTQTTYVVFSLLVYEGNKLSHMDRYYFDGKRITMENITQ